MASTTSSRCERRAQRIPGLAACIVKSGRVAWSKGYGWANIAKRVPMDPDRTVQNIGSISKTVVATAVMQLWEKGKFQLDDDVNERLPFAVRSPSHPDTPITYRLLLTHRSGIADSLAYRSSYACGDPSLPLEDVAQGVLHAGRPLLREGGQLPSLEAGREARLFQRRIRAPRLPGRAGVRRAAPALHQEEHLRAAGDEADGLAPLGDRRRRPRGALCPGGGRRPARRGAGGVPEVRAPGRRGGTRSGER